MLDEAAEDKDIPVASGTPPILAIACVADSKPKYLFEALRLAQAIFLNPAYRGFADLFIGVFSDAPKEYVAAYRELGAKVVELEEYTDKHGPSNKLTVLRSTLLDAYDYVALFDCDLLPVESFGELLNFEGVQAKLADLSTLDDTHLTGIFGRLGLTAPAPIWRTSIDDVPATCYCNAGCIVFSRSIFRSFVERWFQFNDILLANIEVLGARSFFLDQASFCACLSTFLDKFRPLPLYMNFPGHLAPKVYPLDALNTVPKIIHYHDRVDVRTGALDLTSLPNVQQILFHFNGLTADRRKALRDTPLFWDAIHTMPGQRGMSPSRRAGALALVRCAISSVAPRNILDLGCGTFCPQGLESSLAYHGVDFSAEAIRIARQKCPQYSFRIGDIMDAGNLETGDLVLLFDVISAHADRAADLLVQQAITHARKAVLVSLQLPDGSDAMEGWQAASARLGSVAAGFVPVARLGTEHFFLRLNDESTRIGRPEIAGNPDLSGAS